MSAREIKLTLIEKMILQSYFKVIDGLAAYLGPCYEIVLHSLETFDHSVVHIVNGEHTGRKVGSPITDKALQMLEVFEHENKREITYFSKNKKGEPLKSTTIAINGENDRIIGLICMNFYMESPLSKIIAGFSTNDLPSSQTEPNENFAENIDDLITSSLNSVKASVENDDNIMPANKNKVIIQTLHDRGIFNIKDAVIKVADLMGISKNTVYMHLRNLQGK